MERKNVIDPMFKLDDFFTSQEERDEQKNNPICDDGIYVYSANFIWIPYRGSRTVSGIFLAGWRSYACGS